MDDKIDNLYHLDGRVPIAQAVPFGLQHVLAMFVSNITPIMILASVIGLGHETSAMLIQNCMIIAGIGTLIQLYPVWRIGARLPIVMGISFTFLSLAISIASNYGMGTLMGAVIIGGLIEGTLGLFAKYWMRLVPPIVAATMVAAIGFSLLPIGANSFAGGQGSPDFGSLQNWIVGTVTLLSCLCCLVFAKGFLRSLSVLVGLVVGCILAGFMGMIKLDGLADCGIVSLPHFLPFTPEFNLGAILSFTAVYLVSATETIGDTSALCSSALKRNPETREMGQAVCCDGYVSAVSGLFGCTPITSFSQNVGLAAISGVVNRFAIACGAVIMIIGGIFPIVGYILTSIPQCVLGGCILMMLGGILYNSFGMVSKCGNTHRNMVIVSLSLSVGLGFTQATEMFKIFPDIVRDVFADNCVAVVFLLAVILNLILPKEEKNGKEKNGQTDDPSLNFLEKKILSDGVVRQGNVLRVDNFLNHQIDVEVISRIAQELKKRFKGKEVTKVLTIEASGIAIATILGELYDVPVVFAKKGETVNSPGEKYISHAYSFTHKKMNNIFVSKPYIQSTDKVLIVDDFLADGQAMTGLIDIVNQAGGEVVGLGVAIEKGQQQGGSMLRGKGFHVESIAIIAGMDDATGKILFRH